VDSFANKLLIVQRQAERILRAFSNRSYFVPGTLWVCAGSRAIGKPNGLFKGTSWSSSAKAESNNASPCYFPPRVSWRSRVNAAPLRIEPA
jgi:hypothetical protein